MKNPFKVIEGGPNAMAPAERREYAFENLNKKLDELNKLRLQLLNFRDSMKDRPDVHQMIGKEALADFHRALKEAEGALQEYRNSVQE